MNRMIGAVPLATLLALTGPAGFAQQRVEGEEGLADLTATLAESGFADTMMPLYPDAAWADALTIFATRDRDDLVAAIVRAGVDPDVLNSSGSTALWNATLAEAPNSVAELVSLGADVTAERDGLTATDLAEATGNDTILRLVEAPGKISDATRLAIAAQTGDLERIEAILADGTGVNARDADGYTPVLHAALAGNADAVALFAERGAHAEAAGGDGLTALGVLVMSGDVAAVGDFLSRGASADHSMNGIPVLSLAVVAGDDAMVDLLLERGADSTLESDDGATPGMLAMSLGQEDLASRLGGIPEPEPAMDLIAAVVAGDADTVKLMLEAGEDPDQRADNGMPAIVIAAGNLDLPTTSSLVKAGADVTSSDRIGNNAVHAALARTDRASSGNVANFILWHASEVGKLNSVLSKENNAGRSAFVRLASSWVPFGVLRVLRNQQERQSSIRAAAERPDGDGVSPMLAAVLGGNAEMLSLFADLGVSFELPSGQGTAQDLARARQSWASLAALPDDRVVPAGFRKGASRSDKREMQRLLRDWGYYPGTIDGIFGPGSRAALRKFLLDRNRELRAMAPHSKSISHGDPVAIEDGETDYWLRASGTNCTWRIVEWKRDPTNSRFIGCVRADPEWNSHGFALVRYASGKDELKFFGAGGWSDDVPIR